MWIKHIASALIFITALSTACGSKGNFAYKKFDMDSYRTMGESFEFPTDEPFDWAYQFPTPPGKKKMGIIILKKELVWVEIKKDTQNTEKGSPFVHGHIEGFEPGEYKIAVVNGNTLVAEKYFTLFDPALPEKDQE
jgi:hypothetical protein